MEKKKRRSSQVFHFEQTEEALEENEAIRDLYQNKKFVMPEPLELETIIEEGVEKEEHRARRGAPAVSCDGGLVLGVGRGRRIIEGYKYWKQDDKERNKKRKSMLTKQWRGRKKPKIIFLDFDSEQKLQVLIDTREESDEDDEEELNREEDCAKRLHGDGMTKGKSQIVCVWGKGKEGSGSSIEDEEGCVWGSRPNELPNGEVFTESEPPCPIGKSMRGWGKNSSGKTRNLGDQSSNRKKTVVDKVPGKRERPSKKTEGNIETNHYEVDNVPVVVVTEEPDFDIPEVAVGEEVNTIGVEKGQVSRESSVPSREGSLCTASEVSLATLCSMIPAGELAELMETEDLLFCGKVREETRRGRESVRRSVRRSARLQNAPLITGSVFREEVILDQERITDNSSHRQVTTTTSAIMGNNYTASSLVVENHRNTDLSVTTKRVESAVEGEVVDEVFAGEELDQNKIDSDSREYLQPLSLASLRILEASAVPTMTPPPLSRDSKENFFLNNVPRIKVTKKGKTKRRVPDQGPPHVPEAARFTNLATAPVHSSNITDSVLKDLSNLSLEVKSKPTQQIMNKKDKFKPIASKTTTNAKFVKTTVLNKNNEIKERTVPKVGIKTNLEKVVNSDNVINVGVTSRRKKKVIAPSPDTTDGGFCFSGNFELDSSRVTGKSKRRESLRSAGGRAGVNYCEESEKSGSVSRRSSAETSKNSILEGSNRNSVLATSGEREIDISMPAAVRRSLTGEFVPRLNLPSASTEPLLHVSKEVKPVVSVGDAFWSDSEEEEIISGIFGKKTLAPWEQKLKTKINRGFLN